MLALSTLFEYFEGFFHLFAGKYPDSESQNDQQQKDIYCSTGLPHL